MKIFNTLSRKKEIFRPLKGKSVGLYTCGPTVYNYAHIGNLRTYIFEDLLKRTLEYSGYKVKKVMNITDIEDKIIRDAQKAGKTIYEFTKPYEKAFFEDLIKLNISEAFKYPQATKHIKEMITIISSLLKKGLAYEADGSVYFDISKFKKYGRLSGLQSRELKTGARVDNDEYTKDNAEDFVLWKSAKPGEPSWKAPFGEGRPGWHIECSAMSMKYLGETFDAHAGAVDLIFPHHENEIAQSEGFTGKLFSKYFIEGEHLLVNGEKMSKSLNNFFTLRDIESRFNPLAFRYLVLTAHYRSKLNFSWDSLRSAQTAYQNLKGKISLLKNSPKNLTGEKTDKKSESQLKKLLKDFETAIDDDLNSPQALAALQELVSQSLSLLKEQRLSKPVLAWTLKTVAKMDEVLGLKLDQIPQIPPQIAELLKERELFRINKQFAQSDALRKEIEALGYSIEDTPAGPLVYKSD